MNSANYDKTKKNCLLVFCNKKAYSFKSVSSVVSEFSSCGYYFEKASVIAFDSSFEIVKALADGLDNHENVVIVCPLVMKSAVKDFVSNRCGGEFDDFGILNSRQNCVYMLVSDAENRLTVKDVCRNFDKKYGVTYEKAFVRTVGAPWALIDDALKDANSCCPELEFNVTDKYGDCRIEIVYDSTVSKTDFDRAYRAVVDRLKKYVYALEDISLAERLVQLLKLRRMKISAAESFTGGGVGKRLVEISGVSEVFVEGLNTYANESKMRRLGVGELTLKQHGAVSKETAAQMAEGLLAEGNCNVSVSTTGIAGPKSDNTNKPVGLAYIGVANADGTEVYEYNLKGSREDITETAINLALFAVFKKVK